MSGSGRTFTRASGRSRASLNDAARRTRAVVEEIASAGAGYRARLLSCYDGQEMASAVGETDREALRALRAKVVPRGRGVYSEEMRRTDLRAIQAAIEMLR